MKNVLVYMIMDDCLMILLFVGSKLVFELGFLGMMYEVGYCVVDCFLKGDVENLGNCDLVDLLVLFF